MSADGRPHARSRQSPRRERMRPPAPPPREHRHGVPHALGRRCLPRGRPPRTRPSGPSSRARAVVGASPASAATDITHACGRRRASAPTRRPRAAQKQQRLTCYFILLSPCGDFISFRACGDVPAQRVPSDTARGARAPVPACRVVSTASACVTDEAAKPKVR